MEKYCPKCGKNIEKNTCECQNKKSLFKTILDFIMKPIDTVNDFVKTASKENSYLLILLSSFVIAFCIIAILSKLIHLIVPATLKYLLVLTIIFIICFLIFTLILNMFIKLIENEVTFEDILKIVSSASISLIYAFLITTIIFLLLNKVTLIIILIGMFVFIHLIIEMLVNAKKIDSNKSLLICILTILMIAILITILF